MVVKYAVMSVSLHYCESVNRYSRNFYHIQHLIPALFRKKITFEKCVSVFEHVFNIRNDSTCSPKIFIEFIRNDVSVLIECVSVSFFIQRIFFEIPHVSVLHSERIKDFFADNFIRVFLLDPIDDKSCNNKVCVAVCPVGSRLKSKFAVDLLYCTFKIFEFVPLENAGSVVEQHSDSYDVSFFKVGKPLVNRLVEVDFAFFLEKQHCYCRKIFRDASDFKKIVGRKHFLSFAVAYAVSQRGELINAVTNYNADAVGEIDILFCKISDAFEFCLISFGLLRSGFFVFIGFFRIFLFGVIFVVVAVIDFIINFYVRISFGFIGIRNVFFFLFRRTSASCAEEKQRKNYCG